MTLRATIFLFILIGLIILYIIAIRKKWIGKGSGIFTSQVMMHDMLNKNKQHAMEYVMEDQERTIKEDDESGEDPEGGKKANEQ